MKRLLNKKLIGVLLALSLIATTVYYAVPNLVPSAVETVRDSLVVGTVEAAGVADATCDGVADDVQAQALLTALPATGGRISILTGTYVWANATTVTRAINGVTITGTGIGTSITGDAVTAPFTAGGNNWVLQDFETDVTAAVLLTAMGATTGWEWRNVTTSDVYFAYRTDDATTAVSWDIPTGRGATYTVAASDAPANVIAQADYVCDGTADNVEINAAISAINATGNRGAVQLVGDTFTCSAAIVPLSDVDVFGPAHIVVNTNNNIHGIDFNNITNSVWVDVTVTRSGVPTAGNFSTLLIRGTTDSTVIFENCTFLNTLTAAFTDYFGVLTENSSSSTFYNCYAKGGVPTQNGDGWRIQGTSSPVLYNCVGQGGDSVGTRCAGINITVTAEPRLYNCEGIGGALSASANSGIVINGTNNTVFLYNCQGIGGAGTSSNGIETGQNPIIYGYNLYGKGGSGNSSKGFTADGVTSAEAVRGEIHNSTFIGGDAAHSVVYGMFLTDYIGLKFYSCTFTGGPNGTAEGLYENEGCRVEYVDCRFESSPDGTIYGAVHLRSGSRSIFSGCTFISGMIQGYGIRVEYNSSPVFTNCIVKPPEVSGEYLYTGGGADTFTPIAVQPYQVTGLALEVTVAGGGGSTVDIGTTLAGTEIATGISTAVNGWQFFTFNKGELAGAAPIHITPTDANARFHINWTVCYNNANCYAVYNRGSAVIFTNSYMISNGASDCWWNFSLASNRFTIENCILETYDPVNQFAFNAQAAITNAKIINTRYIGLLNNITSLYGRGLATITAAVTSVVVTHNLGFTPRIEDIVLTAGENPTNAVGSMWVSAVGATQFTINCENVPGASNLDVYWKFVTN